MIPKIYAQSHVKFVQLQNLFDLTSFTDQKLPQNSRIVLTIITISVKTFCPTFRRKICRYHFVDPLQMII